MDCPLELSARARVGVAHRRTVRAFRHPVNGADVAVAGRAANAGPTGLNANQRTHVGHQGRLANLIILFSTPDARAAARPAPEIDRRDETNRR